MTEKELVAALNSRCEQHMENIGCSLDEIKSAVFGNGKEGLMTRMTKAEMHISSFLSIKRWVAAVGVAVVGAAIIGIFSQWRAAEQARAIADANHNTVVQTQKLLQEIQQSIVRQELAQ